MAASSQPTILVKKSDGTFARMSLDEVKKMKTGKTQPPAVIARSEAMKQSATLVIPVKTGIQTVAVKPATRDSSASLGMADKSVVGMTGVDAKSLLEEDVPLTIGSPVAVRREAQVDAVIKKLTFSVPPNFTNRLRSAVQLRLKEVRGEKETRATVLRSIKDGGLGLTEAQAAELEKACLAANETPSLVSLLKRGENQRKLMAEGQILPARFFGVPLPAKTTPFNAFVHEEFLRKNAVESRPTPSLISPLKGGEIASPASRSSPFKERAGERSDMEEKFKISPPPVARPAMKDVVAVAAPVSPIDEINFFTLTDFRRLGEDPAQAAKRLAQKFLNLKEESVLLFWQAIDAWRQSPLFSDYVGVLNRAITGQKPAMVNSNIVTGREIEAVIQMEKDLGI